MPAIATPPVRMPPAAPLLRPVEIGEVMPFHKHPRGEMSEIRVRPWTTFPELLKWDEAGRPAGWSFGLPLPASYWPAPDEAA